MYEGGEDGEGVHEVREGVHKGGGRGGGEGVHEGGGEDEGNEEGVQIYLHTACTQ